MSNDVYHSITQIPTFITKTGIDLVNNYPDRYASDRNSISSCSVESYYLGGYYGDSYEYLFDNDHDFDDNVPVHSISLNVAPENQNIIRDDLKQSIKAISVDFPQNSNTHSSLHCQYSCHNSNSSIESNGSSSSSDHSSDPDVQKTRYIIKKIKKLILKGRNNSQILVDDDMIHNSNLNDDINENKSNILNTVSVETPERIDSSSKLANIDNDSPYINNEDNKFKNNDINICTKSQWENMNNCLKINPYQDAKISLTSVKKKDNIYDINSPNNSKYSFLYQKDQFLKTLICTPTMLSPQTTFDRISAHIYGTGEEEYEDFTDSDDDEHINVTSEEIDYLKDHPPHFHSSHNHSHHSKGNNRNGGHHSYRRHTSNYNPSSKYVYNRNLDAKTNLFNIHQQYEERSLSSLIDPTQSKGIDGNRGSDILLHQIKNRSYPNYEKIYDASSSSVNPSNIYLLDNDNPISIENNTLIPSPISKHVEIPTTDSLTSSTDALNNNNDDDNSQRKERKSNKTLNLKLNSQEEEIKHIHNCSCNHCIKKSLNQEQFKNKIPSLSKSISKRSNQTPRTKYNIFDSIYYENNKNSANKGNESITINENTILTNNNTEFLDNNQNLNLCLNPDIQNALVSVGIGIGLNNENNNNNTSNMTHSKSQKSLPSLTTVNVNIESCGDGTENQASSSLEKLIDNNSDAINSKDNVTDENEQNNKYASRPIARYCHNIINNYTNFIHGKEDESYQENIDKEDMNEMNELSDLKKI